MTKTQDNNPKNKNWVKKFKFILLMVLKVNFRPINFSLVIPVDYNW